ncbi:hypothetical protein [Flavisolibacter ginsenosidimutans]|uniref:Uncharacterized protein n=1 Tax=Flavisolibacter ginsenosidimutans TaxID=661481 RepID=A0A5B8UJ24_9BACT|nr:hypothetical protein [Flavisolibacter ginsenosidimutans]QEC56684.1 hypothetical protein FSB75_12515 [Flavisolibacter ginsenosidimutans]
MDFVTNAFLSLTIGIGGVIGLLRFRKIDYRYHPFLFLVWSASIQEILSIIILYRGYSNSVFYNVYSLAEALLLCWQFRRWEVLKSKLFYRVLQAGLALFWLVEWLTASRNDFLSFFIIAYSFLVVLLSITGVNQLLFQDTLPLYRNPVFLLCLCFILYFGVSALVETFWMTGLKGSKVFRLNVYALLCYINLLTNLFFALAILWMPVRLHYILQS